MQHIGHLWGLSLADIPPEKSLVCNHPILPSVGQKAWIDGILNGGQIKSSMKALV
jgi:hypothetical protein